MSGESRVLVVDDEPINLALVRAVLGSEHVVFEALDATRAFEIREREDIDLVLLEVRLPDMDGYSACREIMQRHSRQGYLPVLMLTALADQDSDAGGAVFRIKLPRVAS